MKKTLRSIALLLIMTVLLGACGSAGKGSETQGTSQGAENVTNQPDTTTAPETEENVTPEPTTTDVPVSTPDPTAIPDPTPTPEPWVGGSEAAKLIANMTIGWNLGNTLDSTGKNETVWGNPMTTQEMIDKVAETGFNTVRLPVTWYTHVDKNFTIDEAWLARVKEIVDYCYKNNMYVILNTHHETSWNVPTLDKIDDVEAKFVYLWQQIAEYFKDYDECLLFEGQNEPRVVGHSQEWNGGSAEHRQLVSRLNQAFVDTVRATGGNNGTRVLLITSYGANCSRNAMYAVKVPNDPYVGVSIHAYTPYNFTFYTGNASDVKVWDGSKEKEIDQVFKDINSVFLSKGIPVVMTEFGSEAKNNREGGENHPEERIKWIEYYITKAGEYGVPCCHWDNGIYYADGERFGMLDRKNLTWFEPEYVETMVNAATK